MCYFYCETFATTARKWKLGQRSCLSEGFFISESNKRISVKFGAGSLHQMLLGEFNFDWQEPRKCGKTRIRSWEKETEKFRGCNRRDKEVHRKEHNSVINRYQQKWNKKETSSDKAKRYYPYGRSLAKAIELNRLHAKWTAEASPIFCHNSYTTQEFSSSTGTLTRNK
jgi:hypothetical protein